jgi:hypothetical protein
MPKFNVSVPHPLSQQDATEKLNRFVEVLEDKYKDKVSELSQSWDGNVLVFHFKTYGIPIDGRITVSDNNLAVDGDLPFTAIMFKGKIESSIREQLERVLGSKG